jgi:hypothetical protein
LLSRAAFCAAVRAIIKAKWQLYGRWLLWWEIVWHLLLLASAASFSWVLQLSLDQEIQHEHGGASGYDGVWSRPGSYLNRTAQGASVMLLIVTGLLIVR